ncbi:uncharacterized protein LOC144703620 isoform X4 [Wolffia australiana]
MIRDQGPPDSLRQVVAPLLHMRKKGVGVCRLCDCFRFPPAITDKVYPIFLKRFLQAKVFIALEHSGHLSSDFRHDLEPHVHGCMGQ